MTPFLCFVLSITISWLLVRAHLVDVHERAELSDRSTSLDDQRARCVQVVHDLELDFHTGKISESDYESTKKTLSAELGAILRDIDDAR